MVLRVNPLGYTERYRIIKVLHVVSEFIRKQPSGLAAARVLSRGRIPAGLADADSSVWVTYWRQSVARYTLPLIDRFMDAVMYDHQ
jgi:hypothetical protein